MSTSSDEDKLKTESEIFHSRARAIPSLDLSMEAQSSNDVRSVGIRSRPRMLTETIASMTKDQKQVVKRMGFGGVLGLKLKNLSNDFVLSVIDQLDPVRMVIHTHNGDIPIDRMAVHEVYGFPMGHKKFISRNVTNYNSELGVLWKDHTKKNYGLKKISERITENTKCDRMFQLDFLILMSSLLISASKNNICNREILATLPVDFVCQEYDWCEYVLIRTVETCKEDLKKKLFCCPAVFLLLLYCDRVSIALDPPVLRNRPVVAQWKNEDIQRRFQAKSNSERFGEFLVEWRKTSEAKEYRSKKIHFEECGCLGWEDDEDVTEVEEDREETTKENYEETTKENDVEITASMTLLDVNDDEQASRDGASIAAPIDLNTQKRVVVEDVSPMSDCVKANKEISRKISELGCSEEEIVNEKPANDRDVWIDLVSPGGEVLGYGAGVTKSDVTSSSNELRKMRGENYMNSNYVHKLLVQTKSQNSVIESLNRTIASLNKTVETLTNTIESHNEKMVLQDEKLETQTKKVEELENTVVWYRDEVKLLQTLFQGEGGSSDMFSPTQAVSHEGYDKKKKKQHGSLKN